MFYSGILRKTNSQIKSSTAVFQVKQMVR